MYKFPLQWRHNERDCVWNHQSHHCLFRRRSKKTSKLRVTGLYIYYRLRIAHQIGRGRYVVSRFSTHWGRDKIAAILQTIISTPFLIWTLMHLDSYFTEMFSNQIMDWCRESNGYRPSAGTMLWYSYPCFLWSFGDFESPMPTRWRQVKWWAPYMWTIIVLLRE